MYRFLKTPDPDNPHDRNTVSIEVANDETNLQDIVSSFQDFLRAVGFTFDEIEITTGGDDPE